MRVTEDGHLGARGGVDMMVAMNPQTWDKDVASIEPGGYLFYDSTKPMPASKFRADITVIGVPLTAITNSTYTDPRQRQLFKNIIYLGAMCALLDMDPKIVEQLIGEQYKGKEKLLSSNVHALHLGRDWALQNLKCPIGLRVKKADKVGDRIFIEGNSAAALGAVYGGATVCAWYPITPSSSVADAFTSHCKKLRHDPETGKAKYAIVQGEDELASIGIVIGASWNGARAFTATSGPGISLMTEFIGLSYFAEIPAVIMNVQRAGPSTGHADANPAMRHHRLRLCLAWRHQACAAVSGRSGRSLRIRRAVVRSRRTAADHDLPDARPRHRHEPPAVPPAEMGRRTAIRPRQGDDGGDAGRRPRLRPLSRRRRRRHSRTAPIPAPIPTKGSFFTRGTSRDRYARYSEEGAVYADNMQRLVRKFETAQDMVPRPLQANAAKPTKYGVIYFGSTAPAMDEAIGLLEARGHQLDRLRIRAFPFHSSVASFIADHDFVYVVEQNRDAQLRSLIVNENGIDPVRLVPILHYDGTPITARFIAGAIGDHQDQLKVTPLRKVKS